MFGLRYLPGVATLSLDLTKCNGCRMCLEVCPQEVFEMADKKARIADPDGCMECGACAINCPEGALSVRAGVGCASAVLTGAVRGTEPTCSCSGGDGTCC